MEAPQPNATITVHGTRIAPGETLERYREKIARIIELHMRAGAYGRSRLFAGRMRSVTIFCIG